jgi:hypothetical protein
VRKKNKQGSVKSGTDPGRERSRFATTRRGNRSPIGKSETSIKYGVTSDVAKILDKKIIKIQRRSSLLVTSVIEIGRELLFVKKHLPHGMFRPFVINEFPFSFRKAELWMNCVALADQNPDIVRNFQPTVLYKLAAPGTPNSVRESVFAAMRDGQPCPSVDAIKREIEEARASKLTVQVIDLSKADTDADEFVGEDDEMSGAASELLAIFLGNLPTERLGTTARLLRHIDGWDLRKMASKIGFQALRVSHLNSLEEEELEN